MPITQIRVGAPSNVSATDGNAYDQLGGKSTEGVVTELHGKYYTQNYRGNCFMVSTVGAGLAIPISSTVTPVVMLWNPLGSGKNLVPMRFTAVRAMNTTTVQGAINLLAVFGAGSVIATGSAITAFNQSALGTNLFNAQLGGGILSVMKSSANGTNTLAAASVAVVATMGGLTTSTLAGAVAAPASVPACVYDFDGTLIIPPGVAVYPCMSAGASAALVVMSFAWAEVPV